MRILNKILTATLMLMCLVVFGSTTLFAQQKTDSLIVNVGKSQIVFLIKDKADLEKLQKYDLNEILDRLSLQLTGDSTLISENGTVSDTTIVVDESQNTSENDDHSTLNIEDSRLQ